MEPSKPISADRLTLQVIKWAYPDLKPNSTINSCDLGQVIKQLLKLHFLIYKMPIIVPTPAFWLILPQLFSENSYVNSCSKTQTHMKSTLCKY